MNISILAVIAFLLPLPALSATVTPDWPNCSLSNINTTRNRSLELFKQKRFSDAAQSLNPIFENCYNKLDSNVDTAKQMRIAYFWAFSDYVLSLKKSGDVKNCITNGRGIIDAYPQLYDDKDAPEIKALLRNTEVCEKAWEKQFSKYVNMPCKRPNTTKAISVPENWGFSKADNACIAFHSAKISAEQLDRNERGKQDEMDFPYLFVISGSSQSTKIIRYTFSGGRLGTHEVNFDGTITIHSSGNKRLVRLIGSTPYLWPGSAVMSIDAIYELSASGTAVLVDEIQTDFH